MTLIIAQDPGKTTGMATYDTDIPEGTEKFASFELSIDEYFDWIGNTVHEAKVAGKDIRLVSESFLITVQTAKNTQAGWSLEMIGVAKFLAHRYGLPQVVLQSPSVGKTFGTDSKLKHVGWHKPGKGHANDAARHLMTYAATRKLIFTTQTLMELAQG